AKASPDDLLMFVTVHNRGPEDAVLHVLPQVWFRNTWSWKASADKPELTVAGEGIIEAHHRKLGNYFVYCDDDPALLFCDNETNARRLYGPDGDGHFKDGINDCVVHGDRTAVNSEQAGTKAAAHYLLNVRAHSSARVRLRLTLSSPSPLVGGGRRW